MTIEDKNKWRVRFKVFAALLVLGVLVGGVVLALAGKIAGFAGIAGAVCTFATGVFGMDYWTSPTDTKGQQAKFKDNLDIMP